MSNDAFRTFLFAYQMIPVIQFEAARAVNDDGTQVQPEGGIQFLEETFSCHCHGENAQTRSAGHIFHCARTKGMDVRHNELGREVIEMIRSVNATTTAQLLHVPGTPMVPRPDIAVSGLPRGEQAWVEVSCINQLQGGRVGRGYGEPAAAFGCCLRRGDQAQEVQSPGVELKPPPVRGRHGIGIAGNLWERNAAFDQGV